MTETTNLRAAGRWAGGCVLVIAGGVAAPFANADTLLLESTTFINGSQSAVYSLSAPSAGALNVKLTNLDWPERLSSLSFALTTASGVLDRLNAEGTLNIDLTSAGTYYAVVAGTAQGMWNAGMFSLKITFDPLAGTTPVPLPAGLWLLLSGLAGVWGIKRVRFGALVPSPSPAH
jgi:hypothetical protein